MSLQKSPQLFLLASLIGLVAAGGLIAWASALHAADEAGTAFPEPASLPRGPNPQANFDARLIGTAVVEGGPSIAFFQLASGTRFVREGDEIVAGVRLVKVWRNRIDVERAGVHQEIRPGPVEEPRYEARSDSIRTEAVRGDVDRLWETQGRTGRSLFYSHYRKPQN